MPHYTNNSRSPTAQTSHAAASGAPSPYNQDILARAMSCQRCNAPLSLIQGSIIGLQIYCINSPCRCADPDPSVCLCEVGALHQAQASSGSGTMYRHSPLSQRQEVVVTCPYLSSQLYAYPYRAYTSSTQGYRPSVVHDSSPAVPVGGLGQTQSQMQNDTQYVGTHLDGNVPPTSPSPDILTEERPRVLAHEPYSLSSSRRSRRRHNSHGHGNGQYHE
ncbi:hypothetical protein F5Y19DRAFT_457158 [Xylariaceae sp. FL1651]|nr:hypothetical protein F5Y19DRAFT_457158 [Xylariaceae sp. FL1651]